MQTINFHGDAFSAYFLTRLLWDEPKLKPFLGADGVNASHRRAAAELRRARRALQARQQARSTRTLLLNPLAAILDWTLGEPETVQTDEGDEDAGQALTVEGRIVARVLALAPDAPLDQAPMGTHRRYAPTLGLVRVLEAQNLTWGILLNAHELRLVRRAEGFVASHIGFDLSGVQEGVGSALGRQVENAVVGFLQGLASHPANAGSLPDLSDETTLRELYAEALRILYRLLFALYAESRGLLPLDLPFYRENYAVSRLARRVTDPESDPRRHPTPSGRFWEHSLRAAFALLREGANLGPEGVIPKYDGALFDPARTPRVDALVWGDETVAALLERLTLVPAGRHRGLVRLSYRELDVEQLGAVYESLLEKTPQFAAEPLFRVALDNRELVVNAAERARLAQDRGESQTAGAADAPDADNTEVVPPDDPEEADDAEEVVPPEDAFEGDF